MTQVERVRYYAKNPESIIGKALSADIPRYQTEFPFCSRVATGSALFVGEGNMSFSLSIARTLESLGLSPRNLTATTYEAGPHLPEMAEENTRHLQILGADVLHGIDATQLSKQFVRAFETIVFQFPNLGSRRSAWGSTANHHLIRRFLRSARDVLALDGLVVITTINEPFYHGLFDIERAAKHVNYDIISLRPFRPANFDGYSHVNTANSGSALRTSRSHHRPAHSWILAPS